MAKKEVDEAGAKAGETFNMTPMIDVCFQLIVVFLCSMKFRTLDQKIEAFLPKDVGLSTAPAASSDVETKVNVKLRRKKGEETTKLSVLDNSLGTTTGNPGLWGALSSRLKDFSKGGDQKVKGEIDADAEVPHEDVMHALDAFMAVGLTDVSFKGTQLNKTGTFSQPTPKR